jgi:CRISPR-associated protein Cas1
MSPKRVVLYIKSPAKLSQYRGRLKVTKFKPDGRQESKTYPLHSIEAIIIVSKQVSLSGGFLELVITAGLPVIFFRGSDYATIVSSRSRDRMLVKRYLKRLQDSRFRLSAARELVYKRILALESVINEFFDPDFSFYTEKNLAKAADSLGDLRVLEAHATKRFYGFLKKYCQEHNLYFEARKRNPPEDVVNALISYGNAILYSKIYRMLIINGFEPFYGILHRDSPLALAFDISDPYKPLLVERTILQMIRLHEVREELFSSERGLNPELKKNFVQRLYKEFEKRENCIEKSIKMLKYAIENFPKVRFEVILGETI